MNIITRTMWGARPPKTTPVPIAVPTAELWLHHSAGSGTDAAAVRGIQNFHMDSRGWNDIAYSFLIDDDPEADQDVFKGRGAGIRGGHTAGHNSVSHAICVIGDFTSREPHESTIDLIVDLVRYGHGQGWWPLGFTGGHRDVGDTDCPGDRLYALIPTINQRIRENDTMWQYITIDASLVEHAFAQGWIAPNTAAAKAYWLGLLGNSTDPNWEDFRRAVTNGLVRAGTGGGVTAAALTAAVAAHEARPGDKDGVHTHDHKVTITQDIAGTAV